MNNLRKNAVFILTGAAVLAAVIGIYQAIHSPLFTVQVVEVTDQVPETQAAPVQAAVRNGWTPVGAQELVDLAAVPVGEANLFDLDLQRVEKRILSNEWIREVRLQKRFPQTLSIYAAFREPQAMVQLETGNLAYVDDQGHIFGKVGLTDPHNLVLITHGAGENGDNLKDIVDFLKFWNSRPVARSVRVESLKFDPERGYHLLVSYKMSSQIVHSRLDLGKEISDQQFTRLEQVFNYLQSHSLVARQIFADADKKIVVKTTHGS